MWFESRFKRNLRCFSAVFSAAILLLPGLHAQAPASLQITIIDGEDAMNNIRQRTAREPIVQVEDQNHKPIAGAAVVFLLPNDGASGTFAGGARTLTTVTDSQGRAVARGLRPNHISGRFQIRVQASYQGQNTQTTINQTNASGGAGSSGASAGIPKWLIVVAAGAVAATAAVVASRSGSSTPAANTIPVAVTPGAGSVGAPH